MYQPDEDEIAFSAGGEKIMGLEYDGTDRTAIFSSIVELDEELLDINNNPGTPGQVLSSTGAGVDWVDVINGPLYKVKNTGSIGTPAGLHTVTFPSPVPSGADYVINLSVEENVVGTPIFISIVNQTATGFSVRITELSGGTVNPIGLATWHYTIYTP